MSSRNRRKEKRWIKSEDRCAWHAGPARDLFIVSLPLAVGSLLAEALAARILNKVRVRVKAFPELGVSVAVELGCPNMNRSQASSAPRVVLLVPSMRHGGAERAVSRLFELLSEDWCVRVVVFDGSDIGYGMSGNVTSLALPSISSPGPVAKAVRTLRRAHKLRAFNRDNRTDITYSFGDTANLVSILSGGADAKITSLRGARGLRLERKAANLLFFRPMLMFLASRADRVVAVSEDMRDVLTRRYRLSDEKAVAIPNGYDLAQITEKAADQTSLDVHGPYFLAVGSHRQEKRFDHLVRSFAASRGATEGVSLVICGADPEDKASRLVALAYQLNVGQQVKILPFVENPFPLMKSALASLVTSESEGFPNALVEAMATGCAVVATDCPTGPSEILRGRASATAKFTRARFGVLVRPPSYGFFSNPSAHEASVRDLGYVLDMLIDSADLRRQLSVDARAGAERFSYANWLRAHNELFTGVLDAERWSGLDRLLRCLRAILQFPMRIR